MNKKIVLGIAGFLGSGKTTAGNILQRFGAEFIEADKVVSELYEPGAEGWKKIVNFLGEKFLKKDGKINRKKLAGFIFEDSHKLRIVNNLIHPLVTASIKKKIADSHANIIVVEAVYFDKKQLGDAVDKILWIDCATDIAKKRIMETNKFDESTFDTIRGTQIKPESVDFVVKNDNSKKSFEEQLQQIMASFTVEK